MGNDRVVNWLDRENMVIQLYVGKDKSRTSIGWGCIGQSSVGFGKLAEVIAG